MPNRSAIFTVWNAGPRSLARRGQLDPGRVNRALGLALRLDGPQKLAEYRTGEGRCQCEDAKYRPALICKHQVAFSVLLVAAELEALRMT